MVKASSSKQVLNADTSIIKNVCPPQHFKFCSSAQEFHDERGLSMVGVDPRTLNGKNDIFDKEWEAVFICPKPVQGSNKKVKAYHVRPEFAEKLVHRHWDVYQEGPFNYEVGQQFAKAFAMENCPAAAESPNQDVNVIAWALFAERAMRSSEERHHIDNKRKKWEDQMTGKGKHSKTTITSTRSSGKIEYGCTSIAAVPTRGSTFRFEEEEQQQLSCMQVITEKRLQEAKSKLENAKNKVELLVKDLYRAEGAQQSNGLVMKLQEQIDLMQDPTARQCLVDMMAQFQCNPQEDIGELENKVSMAKVYDLNTPNCIL